MSRSVRLAMAALLALGSVIGGTATATAGVEPEAITVPLNPTAATSGTVESQSLRLICRYTYTPARDAVVSANCYGIGGGMGFYGISAMCGDGMWVHGEPSVYGAGSLVTCPGHFGVRLLRIVPLR